MIQSHPQTIAAARNAMTLERALEVCRRVTRQHSRTFYLGSRLLPTPLRQAVWAVYAACRVGDDAVDEVRPEGADESAEKCRAHHLQVWWDDVQAAFAGRPSAQPVPQALAWVTQRYPVPLSAFAELHDGLLMDLHSHHFRTMDDLTLYCRRVAGVVGFMVAPICGYDGQQRTLHHALMLGQAMQLTNILRDVGEDLTRGRLYLPADLLDQYGVQVADLSCGQVTPQYRALLRHLSALAREWYAQGRQGIPALHRPARLAVGTAAAAYEGILDDLERHDFDNLHRRAFVSGPRKLLLLAQQWWRWRI